MDREEIIRMAREAGIPGAWDLNWFDPYLDSFAALVAAHEREECAKVCDDARDNSSNPAHTVCINLAHRIRARGTK
jgi:hypothetical protein